MNNRFLITVLFISLIIKSHTYSQLVPAGLQGKRIYDIAFFDNILYVGSDSGVYLYNFDEPSPTWKSAGFHNRKILAVYPHSADAGPVEKTFLTISIERSSVSVDSSLIYCSEDTGKTWSSTDTGIIRSEINNIETLDGFPSAAICGETFAGGEGKLYRRNYNSNSWEKVFDIGIGQLNVVKTNLNTGDVWVGGETAIFAPYIARSTDKGESWINFYPDLSGDNACNSIYFSSDSNIVFAGMEGAVIKTTNLGQDWEITSLNNTPYYFYGIDYNSITGELLACGSTNDNKPGFYKSHDFGGNWEIINIDDDISGISDIEIFTLENTFESYVYISTYGNGVFTYHGIVNKIDDNEIIRYSLFQNYPNPFNPETVITYQLAASAKVELKVFDILGREIETLIDAEQNAGIHKTDFISTNIPAGIYFYRLKADKYKETKKMIILK